MRRILQLAAILALFGAASVRAQITNPDNLVGHPPPPREQRAAPPIDNLQWMWAFTREPDSQTVLSLRDDARFKSMLRTYFNRPQPFWGEQRLLNDTIPLFLTRYGHIESADNRYITIDGCVPRFCPAHGLLWIDLGSTQPLIVFVAVNWSTQGRPLSEAAAIYDLWAYANKPITSAGVPEALKRAIAAWNVRLRAAGRIVPHVAHAILVGPDDTPTLVAPELLGANFIPPQPAVSSADGAGTDPNE